MKLVKYFLSKKPVTILLLVLVLAGDCWRTSKWASWKMLRSPLNRRWY